MAKFRQEFYWRWVEDQNGIPLEVWFYCTCNRLNYLGPWKYVIFKCILHFIATWGSAAKKGQIVITMTSPMSNMWNNVQYCSCMCKFHFKHCFKQCWFIVKLPEGWPFLLQVEYARPHWGIPTARNIQSLWKFRKDYSTERIEKVSF